MSGYKDILKRGWHPEKEGTTLKGQVKSLVGRGDDTRRSTNHTATPLSSLRDPSTFAPPPKRYPNATGTGGVTPADSVSPVSQTGPTTAPAHPGAGAESASQPPPAPPKPWRLDTTGLSTAHLPPPPVRRDGAAADIRPSSPSVAAGTSSPRPTPPSLPPRLPPRSGSASPATPSPTPAAAAAAAAPALPDRPAHHPAVSSGPLPSPPPPAAKPAFGPAPAPPGPEQGYLNQTAISRLGAAGISVPGLGIGSDSTPPAPPPRLPGRVGATSNDSITPSPNANLGELQSRFSQLKTTSSLSVGLDAPKSPVTATATAAAKKKPPPPPPPKKKPAVMGQNHSQGLGQQQGQQQPSTGVVTGGGGDADVPPPIPLGTRPRF